MSRYWNAAALALCTLTYSGAARAWLFHEHTLIGRTAVQSLSKEDAAALGAAWTEVRAGSPRLCAAFGKPDTEYVLGPQPKPPKGEVCADFPMLPATAGDFSCAPDDLWKTITQSDWLPKIAAAAHNTEARIYDAGRRWKASVLSDSVLEAWHDNHLKNFELDPGYLQRARGNMAHFLWPRKNDDLESYLTEAFARGRAPNAAAFYAAYHIAAVRFAQRAAAIKDGQSEARRTALKWMFFSEATALHYLEDGFSAGHAVGRAGDARDRTGTHDYYCEHGVEGRIWPTGRGLASEPDTYVAHGDAFMTREDQRHAASAVRMSLCDVAHVLGGSPSDRAILTSADFAPSEKVTDDTMDTCVESTAKHPTLDTVPPWLAEAAKDPWIWSVLRLTMMPALATDKEKEPHTTLPVFPTEVGVFIGAYASGGISAGLGLGGYGRQVRFPLWSDGGIEVGFGGAGIATAQSDALLVVSAGGILQSPELDAPLAGKPIIPARMGFSVRLRSPFRYVPGIELLYTLPGVILGSSNARSWFVSAAEAGFFGIERQWSTPLGSVQIVALRELGFRYLTLSDGTGASAGFEFPLLEMKPHPWYAGSTGNSFVLQLGATADIGAATMSVGGFLRIGLHARRYLPLTL
jgi:hypothetical protein